MTSSEQQSLPHGSASVTTHTTAMAYEHKIVEGTPGETPDNRSDWSNCKDIERILNDASRHGWQVASSFGIDDNFNGTTSRVGIVLRRPIEWQTENILEQWLDQENPRAPI